MLVSFAVGGCDAVTPCLALMTEAEPCSGRVQMAQECGPWVSLPSLSSHVIFVHLDINADIDVLMLLVKST